MTGIAAGHGESLFETFIFSYNRGGHLRNCIDSVTRHLPPHRITVVDDGSEQPATRRVLEELRAEGHRVLDSVESTALSHRDYLSLGTEVQKGLRYGGLYHNLRRVLEDVAVAPLVLMLEDDVQVVRDVDRGELVRIHAFLADAPSPLLSAIILIQITDEEAEARYERVDSSAIPLFLPRDPDPATSGFAPVGLYALERVRASGWGIGVSEATSSTSAFERFGPRPLYAQSFIAVLPAPPSSRFHGATSTSRIWNSRRTGLHPVSLVARAGAVDDMAAPLTDAAIQARGFERPRPWPYRYLEGAPGLVRRIDSIEQSIRGRISGVARSGGRR